MDANEEVVRSSTGASKSYLDTQMTVQLCITHIAHAGKNWNAIHWAHNINWIKFILTAFHSSCKCWAAVWAQHLVHHNSSQMQTLIATWNRWEWDLSSFLMSGHFHRNKQDCSAMSSNVWIFTNQGAFQSFWQPCRDNISRHWCCGWRMWMEPHRTQEMDDHEIPSNISWLSSNSHTGQISLLPTGLITKNFQKNVMKSNLSLLHQWVPPRMICVFSFVCTCPINLG